MQQPFWLDELKPTSSVSALEKPDKGASGIRSVASRENASEAKQFIGRYIEFYNARRPHRSHGGKTPNAIYSPPALPGSTPTPRRAGDVKAAA